MTNDVRGACVALIRKRSGAATGDAGVRPVALGWKLESGLLPATDVGALCAAMGGELSPAGARRRLASPTLRAFFAEYELVRGSARRRDCSRNGCGRGRTRPRGDVLPAGCA